MLPEHMDDGLTWAWALYWSASMQNGNGGSVSTSPATSTLSTEAPEELAEMGGVDEWMGKSRDFLQKWDELPPFYGCY